MQRKFTALSTIFLAAAFTAAGAGPESDMNPDSLIQYKDINFVHNVEDAALNPVALSYSPTSDVTHINVGYDWGKGLLHNIDGSSHTDALTVGVSGIKRLGPTVVEGLVQYFNENKRRTMWNSTLFQSPLNPFILADAEASDYNTERFRVMGRVAHDCGSNIRIGANVDYNVGVMSDERDPRLETKGMRFIFNPGIQWQLLPAMSVGATAGINVFNESSSYSCLATAVNYKFYLMSGLGTYYPQSGSSYSRTSKGVSWFGSLDLRYDFSSSVKDYISATYSYNDENATDGGSTYQFKAGKYTDKAIHIYNRTSILGSGMAHNIEIRYDANRVDGRWYDQHPVVENGTTRYDVMSSSIKHKQVLLNLGGAYRLDLLNSQGITTFKARAAVDFLDSKAKNFPEKYFRDYRRLTGSLAATKYVAVKKVRLGVSIDGSYSAALSASSGFSGEELAETYSMPMTAYLASNIYSVGSDLTADLPLRSVVLGLSLSAHNSHCTGGKAGDLYKGTNFTTLACGLSLYF